MERELDIEKLINNKFLIVILGPTASGKTDVSIKLSGKLDAEVISADSRQIYKYLNIGTATPTEAELKAVTTHFINMIEPDEYYSAGLFGNQAQIVANDILHRGRIPLVVGGSGLYIKALCEGLFNETSNNKQRITIRKKLQKEFEEKGIDVLYDNLKKYDPVSAIKYSDKNPRRIIRALEHYYITGQEFSEAHKSKIKKDFKVIYFGIDFPRKKLYDRINLRAELMWRNGLIEETKNVLDMGYSADLNSLNTVGYKETIAFLNNELSESEALEEMKKNTRRYAKRQMTWFKKVENVYWLSGDSEEIADKIIEILNSDG